MLAVLSKLKDKGLRIVTDYQVPSIMMKNYVILMNDQDPSIFEG